VPLTRSVRTQQFDAVPGSGMTERYRIDRLRIRQPPMGSGFPGLGGEALEAGGCGDLQRPQRLIGHQERV
jgi:hypothetical protein